MGHAKTKFIKVDEVKRLTEDSVKQGVMYSCITADVTKHPLVILGITDGYSNRRGLVLETPSATWRVLHSYKLYNFMDFEQLPPQTAYHITQE